MTVKLETTIPLAVPVAVTRDGAARMLSSLTMTRPKTRHLKQLATLVGAELVSALMDGGAADKDVDIGALAAKTLPLLFSPDRLDAAQALMADLLGITAAEAGEIDAIDLLAVAGGLIDFFPALRSIGSLSSPLT